MGYDLAAARRAIRAECGKQGIDDDARRSLMLRLAGVGSSTELDVAGAKKVLDHLRHAGGKPKNEKNEWAFVFAAAPDRQPSLKKLYRLAQSLKVGKAYIEGIARRMAGATQPLEFCDRDRLHQIVQAVEVHKRRGTP